jgi:putative glutamine amidotransferase
VTPMRRVRSASPGALGKGPSGCENQTASAPHFGTRSLEEGTNVCSKLPEATVRLRGSLTLAAALLAGCATSSAPPLAPLVGITSVYIEAREGGPARAGVFMTYVEAVRAAGGVPVVLPPLNDHEALAAYLQRLDGLVLVGGRDIPPEAYGGETTSTTIPMPLQRWEFESELLRRWLTTDKPVLGICLGSQFANVVQGGTLIGDIPTDVGDEVVHATPAGVLHRVRIDPKSKLYSILGESEVDVWARHHQAVDTLGEGLSVAARSDDDLVEATEMRGKPFAVFVQWHPERMEGTEHREKIFRALVEASEQRANDH